MYKQVTYVEPRRDYTLILKFSNDETKRLDFTPYLDSGVFKQLKDIDRFMKAHVSFDTVEWDEDIDIDPEFLYDKGEKYSP